MRIRFEPSGGIAPGINPADLPPHMSQVAENCDFTHGDLRPLRGLKLLADLGDTRLRSLVYYDGEWRAWVQDVDVARNPVANKTSRTIAFGANVDGPEEWDENSAAPGLSPDGYLLGIPAPATGPTLAAGAGGGCAESAKTTVSILNTVVREWSGVWQEGPPSEAALADLCEGQKLTISSFTDPAGNYGITHRRIYGAVAGTYFLIAEIPISQTSYEWTYGADAFEATELPSDGWDAPPATARGLIIRANGVGVSFDGNEVLVSVPYRLHAWPVAYRQATAHPIRAIVDTGDAVAVLTTGPQYRLLGSDPESMELQRLETHQPCESRRSAVDMGAFGIYAGTDGLIGATSTGEVRNLTEKWYTPEKWRSLIYPASVVGFDWQDKYVGFNFSVTGHTQMTCEGPMDSPFDEYEGEAMGFIFDPKIEGLVTLDIHADGGQSIREAVTNGGIPVAQAGMLALLIAGEVYAFADGSADYLTATWKSKVFRSPKAINMGAAQIIADAYPLTFNLYADGELKHTQAVTSSQPFRLPGGYRAKDWEMEIITSSGPVRYGAIAETARELEDV